MRFNFDALRTTREKGVGLVGTVGLASNDAGLARPTSEINCGAQWGVDLSEQAKPHNAPHKPHIEKPLKPSNGAAAPQAPHAPQQKTKFAPELITNPVPTATPKTVYLVLTYEIDNGQCTCLDPISQTLSEAVQTLRQRFQGRVGRIWHHGVEVTI